LYFKKGEKMETKRSDFVWFDDRESAEYLEKIRSTGNTILLPSISLACNSTCNLRCPHCIYDAGQRKSKSLRLEEKLKLLEEAYQMGAKFLQICHDGEPLCDKTTMPVIKKAYQLGMRIFMYTNGTLISPKIADELFACNVNLGVKCDTFDPKIFKQMMGFAGEKQAKDNYQGIQNLLKAGYGQPFERNKKLYTRLCLVCTLTSLNLANLAALKSLANYCWDNKIFFGLARLEKGGRAENEIWQEFRTKDSRKIKNFVNWCSAQTGIDYWYAQPTPYCIGVCGIQISHTGDVWLTKYGGSCDFTEPNGRNYPKEFLIVGNVRNESLKEIVKKIWAFRYRVWSRGILEKKLAAYEKTKDQYPNGLQDCGSARTYTLFVPFYQYVEYILKKIYSI